MIASKTVKPNRIVGGGHNIKWTDPVMTWLRRLSNDCYQEWLGLARSLLPTDGKALDECDDVVHEAIIETLDSIHDGCEFESQDQLHMHIKRAICLISHVVDSERHWTESPSAPSFCGTKALGGIIY